MRENADLEVWEGMPFRDLALRMSHLQEPYDDHMERMLCDKEWVDASVIHALACVFRVDVAIWQAHQEPHVLGHSMLKAGAPTFGLVPIDAMGCRWVPIDPIGRHQLLFLFNYAVKQCDSFYDFSDHLFRKMK